jgi:simple sugar transport system permease protein
VPVVLAVGGLGGALMGWIIHWFRLPPFLVTLGGMFLARGLALALTGEKRLGLSGVPLYEQLSSYALLGLPFPALVFLVALAAVALLAGWTRFGRTVYALGGNEQSALLMGLAVGRTKVLVYALSGLLAATAGVVHALANGAGDAAVGSMFELDAIAAVVIGGTLLSGGVGSVLGTFLGLLILAVIQTAIYFEGTLSSWWTKIVIGALLLGFILLQRLCARSLRARTAA